MIARITGSNLGGSVEAIASKSVAHRMIICAALADAPTNITCNTSCEDIEATIRCLEALGAHVTKTTDGMRVRPIAQGTQTFTAHLDCGESGSTLRFMLPVAGALGARAHITGAGRLAERPIEPLADELLVGGCDVHVANGFPYTISGQLRPGAFELPGSVSSQFITGLLLACAILPHQSTITVTGELESKPYIDLTLQAMKTFGVSIEIEHTNQDDMTVTIFHIPGGGFTSPGTAIVEGDWSNAAFWLCAGALGTQSISVTGLNLTSCQGDRTILAALARFGARMRRVAGVVTAEPDHVSAFNIDAHDIPDLVPVLAAVASCAQGTTHITGCERLRIKESDRLVTTTEELSALGADIFIEGDGLTISGKELLQGGTVNAHNDHRIAMMAAVAAVRCQNPVTIMGAEAVNKSYPSFFEHYQLLGGVVDFDEIYSEA